MHAMDHVHLSQISSIQKAQAALGPLKHINSKAGVNIASPTQAMLSSTIP